MTYLYNRVYQYRYKTDVIKYGEYVIPFSILIFELDKIMQSTTLLE